MRRDDVKTLLRSARLLANEAFRQAEKRPDVRDAIDSLIDWLGRSRDEVCARGRTAPIADELAAVVIGFGQCP